MNLDIIRPKNETDLLLSITKNCEMLIKHTHTKAQEALEFKLPNQEKRFLSNHQSPLTDRGW